MYNIITIITTTTTTITIIKDRIERKNKRGIGIEIGVNLKL